MRVIMLINAGTYIEKVVVPASKPYITFQGTGRDVTVVEWHDRASDRGPDWQPLRTYNTASVTILSNYFTAKNISFKVSRHYPVVHERPYASHKTQQGEEMRCKQPQQGAGADKVTKHQSHKSELVNAAVFVYPSLLLLLRF
uniref:pectinesterase n=1 Tax=Arundo donax TaxID=35708 RepID=A0A0A9ELR8_ARUDO